MVALALTAAPAQANKSFDAYSVEDPALGTGYVYWKQEVRSTTGKKLLTSSIVQRRLSDGRERVLMIAPDSTVSELFAEGDKVAFSIETTRRDRKSVV